LNGFDPLIAENWNRQSFPEIRRFRDIGKVLPYHGGKVSAALQDLFPDIGLKLPKYKWTDVRNRRKYFEEFARERGLDPLNPDHWHSMPISDLHRLHGTKNVVQYHGGSIFQALVDLFPDVPLDRQRLHSNQIENKRRVFEEFAKRNGFDPLSPLNWASQPRENLTELAGGRAVQVLFQTFPNIGLVPSMFNSGKWRTAEQRKTFFEKYANENNFDPSDAAHWYKHCSKIRTRKGGIVQILRHHGSVAQALVDLFPNIEFDKSRL